MLEHYRTYTDPTSDQNFYDLRVGYGGHQGPLTNIDNEGFASMSMHSFPDTLEWDPYSGDYGLNCVGHILGAGTYLVQHPVFGWVNFGGDIVSAEDEDDVVTVLPRDAVRQRIYLASIGLYVTLDAGGITEFSLDMSNRSLSVQVADSAPGSGAEPAKRATVKYTTNEGSPSIRLDGASELEFNGGKASLRLDWD